VTDDPASIIRPMGLSPQEWEKFWADFDDLEKRAAATDERIEKRKEEIARVKERAERAKRRLLRYG
jgi:ubiquinone biosynthesis protein UbiJ